MAVTKVYVDLESGSDAGAGTSGDPYLTIAKAHDDHTATGTEISIQGDNTAAPITTAMNLASSGTGTSPAGRMIYRQWEDMPRPTIVLSNVSWSDNATRDYVSFVNLDITHSASSSQDIFGMTSSSNFKTYGCKIQGDGTNSTVDLSDIRQYLDASALLDISILNLSSTSGTINNCYVRTYGTIRAILTATTGYVTNTILHVQNDSDGIQIGNNDGNSVNNMIIGPGSGPSSKTGLKTTAVENANHVQQTYIEGFATAVDLNNTNLSLIQDIIYHDCTAGFVDVNGLTTDSTCFDAGKSLAIQDENGFYAPSFELLHHWGMLSANTIPTMSRQIAKVNKAKRLFQ